MFSLPHPQRKKCHLSAFLSYLLGRVISRDERRWSEAGTSLALQKEENNTPDNSHTGSWETSDLLSVKLAFERHLLNSPARCPLGKWTQLCKISTKLASMGEVFSLSRALKRSPIWTEAVKHSQQTSGSYHAWASLPSHKTAKARRTWGPLHAYLTSPSIFYQWPSVFYPNEKLPPFFPLIMLLRVVFKGR